MQHGSTPEQAHRWLGVTAALTSTLNSVLTRVPLDSGPKSSSGLSSRRRSRAAKPACQPSARKWRKRDQSPEGFGDSAEHPSQTRAPCGIGWRQRQPNPQPPKRRLPRRMSVRCNNGTPYRGNVGWILRGCRTASSKPWSSQGIPGGRQELAPRPPYWSSCWTVSAASRRICTLSTGAVALRWPPAAPPQRHARQPCVCEPSRRGCSGSRRRTRSGPRRRGGAEHSGGGAGLRNGPAVTQLRSRHPRTTSTHGESALGSTKNHHFVPSYTSSPTLSFISTSLPSERATAALTTRGNHERASVHDSVTRSLRLKLEVSHDLCRPSSVLALLNNLGRGGYAGGRLGEAQNPGPATYDRDRAAAEQRIASLRRINEGGDSVPGSQDSVTRGVQNVQNSDAPAIQTARFSPSTAADALLRRGRNSSPESIVGVRRVVQIPPSEQSPTTASCCTWFRNTGDDNCFQKALRHLDRCILYSLRHHQVVAMSPVHLLRK